MDYRLLKTDDHCYCRLRRSDNSRRLNEVVMVVDSVEGNIAVRSKRWWQ